MIALWMGDEYVRQSLIYIVGFGAVLPLSQSALIRVLIGLGHHRSIAKWALFLTMVLYGIGLYLVMQSGPSLEKLAVLSAMVLTIVDGLYIPYYACRKMGLNIGSYIYQVSGRVLAIWLPSTILLVILANWITDSLLTVLLGGAVYGLLVALSYWIWLFPESIKVNLAKKLFKPEN